MIRRLQLRNWRAYENLDLELGPGATFIVASNGIGKTSLIMGAAWGLFGDASRVTAAEEIRGDADDARVVIDLRLPSGIDAAITRSINRKGKVSIEAKLPDREITSQDELDELLTSEFGADTHVLAQLTVMIHGGAVETFQGEFDLQDHLAGVFGVTPLFEGARAAKTVADRTASALRKVKVTQRSEKRAKEDIVAELQSVIDQLTETNEARDQLAEAIAETQTSIRIGADWSRYRAGMGERQEKLGAIAEQASSHLERAVTAETLVEVLTKVDQEITESVAAAENKAASARGKSELIQAAMADLDNADAVCPTCLRPLSEHDANRAEQEHTQHLQKLESEIAEAAAKAEEARAAGAEIHALLEHVRTLPVPLEPETQIAETQLKAAENLLVKQNEELQVLDKKLAVLANTGATLQSSLEEFDAEQERMRELEILYREEGIALATHEALIETGNAITQDYIEPLAAEIESRWKTMFGAGGLNLSPEGHITRQIGSRTLEFGSLSGGEKVWALLLTRLLIAAASTKAPFIWLDEPLEHLDPRLRKVVAGTLAKASAGAGLRQVIVTTYESELARQLMEDVPSASLIYVTASE
ncbi:MAG TPA: AAA family ATPase [Actinomycetota bacterium]|nr:AAA family ATPase [Actinomycetota bacterium]